MKIFIKIKYTYKLDENIIQLMSILQPHDESVSGPYRHVL
jgi:hypothetical protein